MSNITLPITEARNNFLSLVKEADKTFERFVITKKGKPTAVVLSYDEFEGWLETLDILSSRKWVKDLIKAEGEFKKGRFLSFKPVRQVQEEVMKASKRNV